jgi:molecular chaperone DnaK
MKAEAEANADADKKEREIADAVNKGDNIIFSQEKMIEEQKANLKDDEKSALEGLVNELKEAVKAKNVSKINELEGSINSKWNEISQRIYANQGQQQQTTQQSTDEEAAEQPNDVQDAEFEEVKN